MFVLTDANEATYSIEFGSDFSLCVIDRFKLCLAGRHHHHQSSSSNNSPFLTVVVKMDLDLVLVLTAKTE